MDPEAPECPFCTNPATWTDRGYRCLPCGEPCDPTLGDEPDTGLDPPGSLGPVQAGMGDMAGNPRVHSGARS